MIILADLKVIIWWADASCVLLTGPVGIGKASIQISGGLALSEQARPGASGSMDRSTSPLMRVIRSQPCS